MLDIDILTFVAQSVTCLGNCSIDIVLLQCLLKGFLPRCVTLMTYIPINAINLSQCKVVDGDFSGPSRAGSACGAPMDGSSESREIIGCRLS